MRIRWEVGVAAGVAGEGGRGGRDVVVGAVVVTVMSVCEDICVVMVTGVFRLKIYNKKGNT